MSPPSTKHVLRQTSAPRPRVGRFVRIAATLVFALLCACGGAVAPSEVAPETQVAPIEVRASDRPAITALPSPDASAHETAAPTPLAPTTPESTTTVPTATVIRVSVPDFRIDLPVVSGDLEVEGNPPLYALCDVAQYLESFSQPGEGGTVYIFGHAREGMLLPLLEQSLKNDGAGLLGARVELDTSDRWTHVYEIDLVKRHAVDYSIADDIASGDEQVVLQTSEGPVGTIPKLQVAGRLVDRLPTPSDREPIRPSPRVCA